MEEHIPLTEGEPSEDNPITKDTIGSENRDVRYIIKRKQNEKKQYNVDNKRHKIMTIIPSETTQQQIPLETAQLKILAETIQLPKQLPKQQPISVPRKYKTQLCIHDCNNRCKYNGDQCLFIHQNELQEKVQRLKELKEKVQREKVQREKEPFEKEPFEKEPFTEQITFLKKQIQHKDKVIEHFMNTIQTLRNT